jgi:hypothetical protein
VEVFEDEHDGNRLRDRFECFAELAHHPFTRRAGELVLERDPALGGHERRKLNDPCRRMRDQRVDDHRPVRPSGELAERLEQRVVRLLPSEAFRALAACYTHEFTGRS